MMLAAVRCRRVRRLSVADGLGSGRQRLLWNSRNPLTSGPLAVPTRAEALKNKCCDSVATRASKGYRL
jgi:hypothetical protein